MKRLGLSLLVLLSLLSQACWISSEFSKQISDPPDSSPDTDTITDTQTTTDTEDPTDPASDAEDMVCAEMDCMDPCVFHVDIDVNASGDGLSWSTAFKRVQEGINAAHCSWESCSQTCEVWVAKGTYFVQTVDRDNTVRLRRGIELYGGFSGSETQLSQRDWATNETILDGRSHAGESEGVYHVVTGSDESLIDGFTITHGRGPTEYTEDMNEGEPNYHRKFGAGMYNHDCSPRIANCRFENNSLLFGAGGAVAFYWNNAPTTCEATIESSSFESNMAIHGGAVFSYGCFLDIAECAFEDNHAQGQAGAVHIRGLGDTEELNHFYDCTFLGNSSALLGDVPFNKGGGAVYLEQWVNAHFNNCQFEFNTTARRGGAIGHHGWSYTEIHNCSFHHNSSGYAGGALETGTNSTVGITDSEFTFNLTGDGGGGAIRLINSDNSLLDTIDGCTFFSNTSTFTGGAIQGESKETHITNSIFAENTAQYGGGLKLGYQTIAHNCVFFGNTASNRAGGILSSNSSIPTPIENCIFWDNIPDQINSYDDTGTLPGAAYSLIQGGYAGTGIHTSDPLFVQPSAYDFHLLPGSPCIDAANGVVAPATDKDGNPRWNDPATPDTGNGSLNYADIGAYEFDGQ